MKPRLRKPTHPGEILLEEFIKPIGITQTELAKKLGWTAAKLNQIIHGTRQITPKTALDLGDVFGVSPEFWIHLQVNFELWLAEQEHQKLPKLAKVS